MKHFLSFEAVLVILVASLSFASADTTTKQQENITGLTFPCAFPDLSEKSEHQISLDDACETEPVLKTAVWPFSKKDETGSSEVKLKSTRKAFFLSFLLPGLGETYVGSKRGILFLGIEAFSWWVYMSNTNKGNDLEADFQRFANTHWHYTDPKDSGGADLDHNYWKWLQKRFQETNQSYDINPYDYKLINEQLKKAEQNSNSAIRGHSIHNMPSSKTQQYYEMIGKYPQFVYGWEDIDDTIYVEDEEGNQIEKLINPTIKHDDGTIKFDVAIQDIKSPMRSKYEDMRDDSNKKLKAGQRGIHYMLINRVISGIHAARLAYHHNKKLESELSRIDIYFTEKYVIDNRVPMLMFSKKF